MGFVTNITTGVAAVAGVGLLAAAAVSMGHGGVSTKQKEPVQHVAQLTSAAPKPKPSVVLPTAVTATTHPSG